MLTAVGNEVLVRNPVKASVFFTIVLSPMKPLLLLSLALERKKTVCTIYTNGLTQKLLVLTA